MHSVVLCRIGIYNCSQNSIDFVLFLQENLKNLIISYCLSNFLATCQVNFDKQHLPVRFKFEIRALIYQINILESVDIIRLNNCFPTWYPESMHPTDSCFQGTCCENRIMFGGLYQHKG